MSDSCASDEILSGRIRNRAIDCLELVHSRALDANGMINWWDDWREAVLGPPPTQSLSAEELEALVSFDQAWQELVRTTPNPAPPINELGNFEPWRAFKTAATQALDVFTKTGRSIDE